MKVMLGTSRVKGLVLITAMDETGPVEPPLIPLPTAIATNFPTLSPSPVATATPSSTVTSVVSIVPSHSPTATSTKTATTQVSQTPHITATATKTGTSQASVSPSTNPTPANSSTPTASRTATSSPTRTSTYTATRTPTNTFTLTYTPTPPATFTPTPIATNTPTSSATMAAGNSLNFTYPSSGRVNAFWTASEVSQYAKQFAVNPAANSLGLAPLSEPYRAYPSSIPTSLSSSGFATLNGSSPLGLAGWWDDVYMSADGYHSRMSYSATGASSSGNFSIDLSSQKIEFAKGISPSNYWFWDTSSAALGTNFSSQSTAGVGHHVHESGLPYMEKNYASLNVVDGGPACHSFSENSSAELFDSYDAIVTSRYNSLGCSTSEIPAMNKMYIAGGFLPRSTKDLLKSTGNYALVLNSIFRSTLPWTDGSGNALAADSELLNRPVYLSRGSEQIATDGWAGWGNELLTTNMVAHRYDNARHILAMILKASQLNEVPPVPVLKVTSVSVSSGSTVILDNSPAPFSFEARKYLPNDSAYTVRARAQVGQSVSLTLDLSNSFSISGRAINFSIKALHPNHAQFISVQHLGNALVKITLNASAQIPRGRVPVTIKANDGVTDGFISTVNFLVVNDINNPPKFTVSIVSGSDSNYWFMNKYYYINRDARAQFNNNARPIITGEIKKVLPASGSATFTISCSDPEGFPTSWYKNKGEPGAFFSANQYVVTSSEVSTPTAINVICSDGTGVFSGATLRVCPHNDAASCS